MSTVNFTHYYFYNGDEYDFTAKVWIAPAEPQVGIFADYVEDLEVTSLSLGNTELSLEQYSEICREIEKQDFSMEIIEEVRARNEYEAEVRAEFEKEKRLLNKYEN